MSALYTLPISFKKKFGLLISDTDVEFVSWSKGELSRIAIFSNDDNGISRFSSHLKKNAHEYKGASFRILANVIGEDYRVEKTAHLIGKYKTDFHHRRMQQLFRGVSLCMSFVQGRNERGRREDIVLFYGMLTEGKVLPWMNTISNNPLFSLEAVQPVSFANLVLLKHVNSEWRKKSILLMTLHEKGLLRQTYYNRGRVQFSRVSKISDGSAEEVAAAIRKELERTIQYLHSLKISISQGMDIEFICPGNMVGQLRELVKSSEKIRFNFQDATAVAQGVKLSSAMSELGRDSSLSMHALFSYTWFKQLASLVQTRYYWLRTSSVVASILLLLYGASGFANAGLIALQGLDYRGENATLSEQRDGTKRLYDQEFGQLEEPPSSPGNITAVSETFRVLSNINVSPGQLIYYFANAYEKNKRIQLNGLRWYLAGTANATEGDAQSLLEAGDIYQVLEANGEFLPVPNESYLDVASRADILMNSFEERGDISVQAVELPDREIDRQGLGGVLTETFNIDAARERNFRLRIVWKQYDAEGIEQIRKLQI